MAPMEERAHLHRSLAFQQADFDFQSSLTQDVGSSTAHVWVWIRMGDDHPLNARPEEGFRAWRGPPEVVARLEGDVRCCTVGGNAAFFSVVDGHLFSMKPAEVVVPSLCDGHAILHQDTTDGRIRADSPLASLSDLKGPPHEFSLAFGPHRDGRGFGFSHMRPRLSARTFFLSTSTVTT